MTSAAIASFIDRYSPAIARELRAARAHLRSLFPRGCELVFDNYNALVFAFAPDERASQAILSIAAYPRWVTLFFARGATLDDPLGLLQGDGSRIRGVRLMSATQLATPGVSALIAQAMAPHRDALDRAPPLRTIVKSVAAKQRPRVNPV